MDFVEDVLLFITKAVLMQQAQRAYLSYYKNLPLSYYNNLPLSYYNSLPHIL